MDIRAVGMFNQAPVQDVRALVLRDMGLEVDSEMKGVERIDRVPHLVILVNSMYIWSWVLPIADMLCRSLSDRPLTFVFKRLSRHALS